MRASGVAAGQGCVWLTRRVKCKHGEERVSVGFCKHFLSPNDLIIAGQEFCVHLFYLGFEKCGCLVPGVSLSMAGLTFLGHLCPWLLHRAISEHSLVCINTSNCH